MLLAGLCYVPTYLVQIFFENSLVTCPPMVKYRHGLSPEFLGELRWLNARWLVSTGLIVARCGKLVRSSHIEEDTDQWLGQREVQNTADQPSITKHREADLERRQKQAMEGFQNRTVPKRDDSLT